PAAASAPARRADARAEPAESRRARSVSDAARSRADERRSVAAPPSSSSARGLSSREPSSCSSGSRSAFGPASASSLPYGLLVLYYRRLAPIIPLWPEIQGEAMKFTLFSEPATALADLPVDLLAVALFKENRNESELFSLLNQRLDGHLGRIAEE